MNLVKCHIFRKILAPGIGLGISHLISESLQMSHILKARSSCLMHTGNTFQKSRSLNILKKVLNRFSKTDKHPDLYDFDKDTLDI